jgi:uncharacterized protein (DUF488 family)
MSDHIPMADGQEGGNDKKLNGGPTLTAGDPGVLSPPLVFTVGHSTHPLDLFTEILHGHGITAIADVRRFPGSRRQPHFSSETLAGLLWAAGIEYRHFRELGGRRRGTEESLNAGWRHPSFRGYADYMATTEFRDAVEQLLVFAAVRHVAIMCAESQWWRCHRRLIADALLVRGADVRHVLSAKRVEPHELTSFARVDQGHIQYPALF